MCARNMPGKGGVPWESKPARPLPRCSGRSDARCRHRAGLRLECGTGSGRRVPARCRVRGRASAGSVLRRACRRPRCADPRTGHATGARRSRRGAGWDSKPGGVRARLHVPARGRAGPSRRPARGAPPAAPPARQPELLGDPLVQTHRDQVSIRVIACNESRNDA